MVIKLDDVYSIESDTYTYNLKRKRTKEDAKSESYEIHYYPTLESALQAYVIEVSKTQDAKDVKEWIAAIKETQDELKQTCKTLTKELKNAGA